MNSYTAMSISDEDVTYFAKRLDYELDYDIADTIAETLAQQWETDFEYETFMEEGTEREIQLLLKEDPDMKGIRKIGSDHNCNEYRKSQSQGSFDRCGYCGSLIFDNEDDENE